MTLRERIERAKDTARFAGQVLGVAGTIAVLGVLWFALHAAEQQGEEDDFADEGA
jgi:hypothetical protein